MTCRGDRNQMRHINEHRRKFVRTPREVRLHMLANINNMLDFGFCVVSERNECLVDDRKYRLHPPKRRKAATPMSILWKSEQWWAGHFRMMSLQNKRRRYDARLPIASIRHPGKTCGLSKKNREA